jgi:hypothetical protein
VKCKTSHENLSEKKDQFESSMSESLCFKGVPQSCLDLIWCNFHVSRDVCISYVVTSACLSKLPHMRLNKFGPYSFYFPVFVDIIGIFSQCLEISSIL